MSLRSRRIPTPSTDCRYSKGASTARPNLTAASALSKLLQEPHIPLKKILQIIHAILQQRQPVDAHAECKSRNLLRIVAIVLHELEDIRIHHAASEHLDEPRLLTRPTRIRSALPASATDEARHVEFRARLRKGKERRPEVCLHRRSEQRLHRMIKCPLQIAEGNVGIDRQPLDLMKHRRVARIGRIVS